MPYSAKWDDLPEVEVLPNNFRRSVAGLKGSINRIRLVHPSETPLHEHPDEEQSVMMLSGAMDVTIGTDTIRLAAGEVCIIPAGTKRGAGTAGSESVNGPAPEPGQTPIASDRSDLSSGSTLPGRPEDSGITSVRPGSSLRSGRDDKALGPDA